AGHSIVRPLDFASVSRAPERIRTGDAVPGKTSLGRRPGARRRGHAHATALAWAVPVRVPDTRELVVLKPRYIVPYRVRGDTVKVLRLFHSSRPLPERW